MADTTQVDGSTYVSVKNGAQKVYTCTTDHAKMLYSSPLSYTVDTAPPAGMPDMTPITPTAECPFCTMDAVKGHGLPFKGNQTVYACMMSRMLSFKRVPSAIVVKTFTCLKTTSPGASY